MPKLFRHLLCYLIPLSSALAEESPIKGGALSSAHASYDGATLNLKGDVVLDHGLGTMKADEAFLEKQEVGKEFPFSLVRLQDHVLLKMKERGELEAKKATLDFTELKGILEGSERVRYTELFKRKKKEEEMFSLFAKQIEVDLKGKEGKNQKQEFAITALHAQEQVELLYGQGVRITADLGSYFLKDSPSSAKEFLEFSSLTEEPCSISWEGSTAFGERILASPFQKIALLQKAYGTLISFHKEEPLSFSADSLSWDQEKRKLSLKENISLSSRNLGSLLAKESVELTQDEKGEIATITALGKATLTSQERELSSSGKITVDHVKGVISLSKGGGKEQISYREEGIQLEGDQGDIEYSVEDNAPLSITLRGNVKIEEKVPGKHSRFGITDRLSFSPQTNTFILSANPGKKVLFTNPEENLKISAQEIHITQDPVSKLQSVKGIGSVKMHFSAEEETLLYELMKKSSALGES